VNHGIKLQGKGAAQWDLIYCYEDKLVFNYSDYRPQNPCAMSADA